jgi:hypothetical protein
MIRRGIASSYTKPLRDHLGVSRSPVVHAETKQMAEALKAARRFSDLCDVPDEDRGFVKPGDRLTFYAVAEAFLAKYLYGKVQRVRADFTSSTIKITNR